MKSTSGKSSRYSDHPSARGEFWNGSSLEEDETETLIIESYAYEDLRDGDGGTSEKIVLDFEGDDRKLAINKTRGAALVKAFGDDMDDWIGKEVVLFVVDTPMGPGIRIRAAKAAKKGKPTHDRDDRRPSKKPPFRSRDRDEEFDDA